MATGNYPGRARDGEELRADLKQVIGLLPGPHRANVHASYGDTGGKVVDRDLLEPGHFAGWIAWAKENDVGLDFNPTYFAHPKANDGYTLAHPDKDIREFWIRHGVASRRIAEAMGTALGDECVNNHWIPDGAKDHPRGPLRPPRTPGGVARRRPGPRPGHRTVLRGRRGGQALRPGRGRLHGGLQ